MSWVELASFIGLGILTNTAFPIPFEPVLLAFGSGLPGSSALLVCALGSLCAAGGALVDAACFGLVRRGQWGAGSQGRERLAGRNFYLLAAAAGILPVPFTFVRAALLRVRPRPLLFAGIVGAMRFPRYVVTIQVWTALALPEWAGWALTGAAMVIGLELRNGMRRRRIPAGAL